MIRTLIGFLVACAALAAQTQNPAYIAYRETTGNEVVTIQQPASPSRTLLMQAVVVYCEAACIVSFERDGTAATSTTLTPTAISSNTDPPTALAFRASNAGSGTLIAKYNIPAGATVPFDMEGMRLPKVAGRNATTRVEAASGTVRLHVKWTEAP